MPTTEVNIAAPALGAPEASERPPAPPQLADFEILRELEGGDRADLYLARERSLHRLVALKALRPSATLDEGRLKRCLREARTASGLSDAPIVPVFHVKEAGGRTYLVTAYMEGGSLADVLRTRTLEPEEAALVGARVAAALAAAHRRGLVHHAVKPSNVLFDGLGNAFLADFGIGRLPGLGGLPAAVPSSGAVEYVAPELARRGRTSGGSADLYALGATLYEAVSGRPPFTHEDPTETLGLHCFAPVPPLPDSVPPRLSQTILKCLAKNPSARFADAAELAEALGHPELAGRLVDLGRPAEDVADERPEADAEPAGAEEPVEIVEVQEELPRRAPRRPAPRPWPLAVGATMAVVAGSLVFAWHQGALTSSTPAAVRQTQPVVSPASGAPLVAPLASPSPTSGAEIPPAAPGAAGGWAPAGPGAGSWRRGSGASSLSRPASVPAPGGASTSAASGSGSDSSDDSSDSSGDSGGWPWGGWWHGWGHRSHPTPSPTPRPTPSVRPTPTPTVPPSPSPKPSPPGGGQPSPSPQPSQHPTPGSPDGGHSGGGSADPGSGRSSGSSGSSAPGGHPSGGQGSQDAGRTSTARSR